MANYKPTPFSVLYDEQSPLLQATTDQPSLHGTYEAATESLQTSSKSAFVSGHKLGSMPQGASLLTLPGGTSVSINGNDEWPPSARQVSQEDEVRVKPEAENGNGYQRINLDGDNVEGKEWDDFLIKEHHVICI